jgi:hypothetical protein
MLPHVLLRDSFSLVGWRGYWWACKGRDKDVSGGPRLMFVIRV